MSAARGASSRLPITAIVLTYNEEKNIGDCIESIRGWVEKVVVVDSGSTDATSKLATDLGAEVVTHAFASYGAQRNWALQSLPIATRWVLNVDADERVTVDLQRSIERAIARDNGVTVGYLMARRTIFMGRWIRHGGHYPVWHLRLFRTGKGWCEDRLYDQHFFCDGPLRRLEGDLIDTFSEGVITFSQRHLRWAGLEALEQGMQAAALAGRIEGRLSRNPIEVRRWLRGRYGALPLLVRPFLYFFYRYVLRLGFLDGRAGLIFHVLQGLWYRFLVDALLVERETEGAVTPHADWRQPVSRARRRTR